VLGVLLIDKPEGITSHDVVHQVRKRLGTRRVGHAGTLDPIATGLLVLAVGPATRFLQYLPLEPKEYVGTFRFGEETNTYDSEGAVVATLDVPNDLEGRIQACLPSFRGAVDQLPPVYSAVKVAGRPMYDYARKGEEVARQTRRVFVDQFELLGVHGSDADFRIVCSGGTYVRTLAHDLGQSVGCGAHVVALERTQVGKFRIEDSLLLEDVTPSALIPLDQALPPMPLLRLNWGQVARVRTGQFVRIQEAPPESHVGLVDPDGRVLSVARVEGNVLHPECVLPEEAVHEAL
jgi:tRNA pseudouridine55 synthase